MADTRGFTDWKHEPDEFDRQAEDDFDYFEQDDCWNCGGGGYIADCFDGLCVNAEDGCDLCMRRCEYCNPPAKRATQPPSSNPEGVRS
jgi:hypothetical protein